MLEATSFEELKEMAKGEVISIPGFLSDKPLFVRVKRVSLLGLVQKGTIPNTLLGAANELFYGRNSKKADNKDADMKELTKIMTLLAESSLIEPTVKQLEELKLELTDEQIVALFNYTQKGLKGIEKFPEKSADNVGTGNGETVSGEAKQDNKSE